MIGPPSIDGPTSSGCCSMTTGSAAVTFLEFVEVDGAVGADHERLGRGERANAQGSDTASASTANRAQAATRCDAIG